MPEIVQRSNVAAAPEEVWARVSTMAGVNAELAPWVRMTVPPTARGRSLVEIPIGEVAFSSWLLAFGILPFDRHQLRLVEVNPGHGFLERSSSWLQAKWEHERTLTPIEGGTQITDRVDFAPRLGLAATPTAAIVRWLFAHRHARLRSQFGPL